MKTKHGGLNNQDAIFEIVKNFSTVETDLKKHVKVEFLARDHLKNQYFRAYVLLRLDEIIVRY